MIFILFCLFSSVLGDTAADVITFGPTFAKKRLEICDLAPDIIGHIMTFSPQAQGALASSCRLFRHTADELFPYQTIIARNLKLPAILSVPTHVDLEALDGFVVPNTREGKLQALRFLRQRNTEIIPRSPIVEQLKTIYYDELLLLAPTLSADEWKAFGYYDEGADSETFLFFKMIAELVRRNRFDQVHHILTTSLIKIPVVRSVLFRELCPKTAALITKNLIKYLRDKPGHFRPLLGEIDELTLHILLACDYQPEDLLAIMQSGDELLQRSDQLLVRLKSILMENYSGFADDSIFFKQIRNLLAALRDSSDGFPEELRDRIQTLDLFVQIRYNQRSNSSLLPVGNCTAIILMRARQYNRALEFLTLDAEAWELDLIVSDPEFCRLLVQKKSKSWIQKFFEPEESVIWKDRNLISAYYGVELIEAGGFSKIMDMIANKKTFSIWGFVVPTLFDMGTEEDFSKFIKSSTFLHLRYLWSFLFNDFFTFGRERFKFYFLAIHKALMPHQSMIRIQVSFEVLKAIIEDSNLYDFILSLRVYKFDLDYNVYLEAMNSDHKFEFFQTHFPQFHRLVATRPIFCIGATSPLEIARTFNLLACAESMEEYLGKIIKYMLFYLEPPYSFLPKYKLSLPLAFFFLNWTKVNGLKRIEQLPETLEELERRAREKIIDQDTLSIIPFLTESYKRAFLSAILLKSEYFDHYPDF